MVSRALRQAYLKTFTENSRAPSYFSNFFEEQLQQGGGSVHSVGTLYIDRDPVTFQDICRHLQGGRFYNIL